MYCFKVLRLTFKILLKWIVANAFWSCFFRDQYPHSNKGSFSFWGGSWPSRQWSGAHYLGLKFSLVPRSWPYYQPARLHLHKKLCFVSLQCQLSWCRSLSPLYFMRQKNAKWALEPLPICYQRPHKWVLAENPNIEHAAYYRTKQKRNFCLIIIIIRAKSLNLLIFAQVHSPNTSFFSSVTTFSLWLSLGP